MSKMKRYLVRFENEALLIKSQVIEAVDKFEASSEFINNLTEHEGEILMSRDNDYRVSVKELDNE